MPMNSLYELYKSISATAPKLLPSLDTLIRNNSSAAAAAVSTARLGEDNTVDAVRFEIIGKLVLWAHKTKVLFVLDTNANGSGGNQHHYHHHRINHNRNK